MTENLPPASLSIIAIAADADVDGEIREAGPRWDAFKTLFVGERKVPFDKIERELERVQRELDGVLAKIDTAPRQGFKLAEVSISLGISAEGSIGVVSAGVEAGITITFSRAT